ncbi:hypothetical protein A4X09_0g7618, partial [Tilletia walkeri]
MATPDTAQHVGDTAMDPTTRDSNEPLQRFQQTVLSAHEFNIKMYKYMREVEEAVHDGDANAKIGNKNRALRHEANGSRQQDQDAVSNLISSLQAQLRVGDQDLNDEHAFSSTAKITYLRLHLINLGRTDEAERVEAAAQRCWSELALKNETDLFQRIANTVTVTFIKHTQGEDSNTEDAAMLDSFWTWAKKQSPELRQRLVETLLLEPTDSVDPAILHELLDELARRSHELLTYSGRTKVRVLLAQRWLERAVETLETSNIQPPEPCYRRKGIEELDRLRAVGLQVPSESQERLASTLQKLAGLLAGDHPLSDVAEAIKMGQRSIDAYEALLKQKATDEHRTNVSYALVDQAKRLTDRDEPGDLDRALEIGQRIIVLSKELVEKDPTAGRRTNLVDSLHLQAMRLTDRDGPGDLDEAVNMGQRSIDVFGALLEEKATDERRSNLGTALQNQARRLARMAGRGDLDRAIDLGEQSINLFRALLKKKATDKRREDLGNAFHRQADRLRDRGRPDDLDKAINLGQRSINVFKALLEEKATAERRRDLVRALDYQVAYLDLRGTASDLHNSVEMKKESIDIGQMCITSFETLLEEQATVRRRMDVAAALHYQASRLMERDQPGDLESAIAMGERSITLRKALLEERATDERRKHVGTSLYHQAMRLTTRGGPGDLEKAIEMGQRSIDAYEALLREKATDERRT